MMGPVKSQRLLTVLTLSAALVLSGCGGPGSDPAVTVDGTSYSVAEVQQATQQINEVVLSQQVAAGAPEQEPNTPQDLISDLALLPVIGEIVAGSPIEISQTQIRDLLNRNGVADPGPATIDAALSRQYRQVFSDPATLQDPAMADVMAKLQALTADRVAAIDVEVNPRFGAWDYQSGQVNLGKPLWIDSADQDS